MNEVFYLVVLAAIFETVDSGLGMMYGTLLTPVLILIGYPPTQIIPSILISQAIGGFIGSLFHHQYGNADFKGLTPHMRIVLTVVLTGILAATLGVLFASSISDQALKIYIGIIAGTMGVFCIVRPNFTYKWWKTAIIGFIASFNKSSTGGGFGPLCSTGLILGGLTPKTGIALTTLSEVPLCFISFIMYTITSGVPNLKFLILLCLGAAFGGAFGPYICSKMNLKILQIIVGVLAMISGMFLVLKALKII